MNKTQLENAVQFENVQAFKIDGVEIAPEIIKSTFLARIWRSATVVKNKRTDRGVKAVISQAMELGLIDQAEVIELLMTPNKERVAELKTQLPEVTKDEEPSEEDIAKGIEQVLANKGQAS